MMLRYDQALILIGMLTDTTQAQAARIAELEQQLAAQAPAVEQIEVG